MSVLIQLYSIIKLSSDTMAAPALAIGFVGRVGRCAFLVLVSFLLLVCWSGTRVLPCVFSLLLPLFLRSRDSLLFDINVHPGASTSAHACSTMARDMHSTKELDKFVQSMLPYFDDKESEVNWKRREISVIELRKVLHGNGPVDFRPQLIASFRLLLDGILKTVKSLRTTVSAAGCELVKDLAIVLGPSIDPMIDIIFPTMIELCGHTKTLNRKNGDETVTAIVGHVTCNTRLLHYIAAAGQDKNVPPRVFAAGWLKTILVQHGRQCEHHGGLDIIDKSIRLGLEDAKPEVKEPMRSTYWEFAKLWPERATR